MPHLPSVARLAVGASSLVVAAALMVGGARAQTPGVGLLTVADYPLPDTFSPDRDLSFDPTASRLYISDPTQGVVQIFDTIARSFAGSVTGVHDADRLLAVPEEHALFATALNDSTITAIDTDALTVADQIAIEGVPNGLTYAASVRKLYVSNRRGPTLSAIDASTHQVLGSIDLGVPGWSPVFDSASNTVLLLLPSQDQLASIDAQTDSLTQVSHLAGCSSPTAMVTDVAQHLAFVGCQSNSALAVVDLDSMDVVASMSLDKRPAMLLFEPQLGMVYVTTQPGVVYVFREDPLNRGSLQLVTYPVVGPNARSFGLDPTTRHLYTPTLDIHNTPVLREVVLRALPDPE